MKKDVIFFWIPKTAGTSVYRRLQYVCLKLDSPRKLSQFNNEGVVTFGHVSISSLLDLQAISRDFFDRSFKFCFVRNPWDRLVSFYHYKGYDKRMSFTQFVRMIRRKFKLQNTSIGRTLQRVYTRYPDSLPFRTISFLSKKCYFDSILPMPQVGPYSSIDLSSVNPQTDWLLDKHGKLLTDFVGKFENLGEDSEKLFKHMGIIGRMPHLNKTNRKAYQHYYTDETKNIVRDIYKKDIEFLDYTF